MELLVPGRLCGPLAREGDTEVVNDSGYDLMVGDEGHYLHLDIAGGTGKSIEEDGALKAGESSLFSGSTRA